MIQAIENMNKFYKNIYIDFIHLAISIPGVAMRVCFTSITDPAAEFHLFYPKNKDIYQFSCSKTTMGVDPVSCLIDTMRLVKPSFEINRTNHVRKSSVMMQQMHFIFGP